MNDDEQDIGTGTHVEDSRVDPLVQDDDGDDDTDEADDDLIDKIKEALPGDTEDEGDDLV